MTDTGDQPGGTVAPTRRRWDLFVAHADGDLDWVEGWLLPVLGLPMSGPDARVTWCGRFLGGMPLVEAWGRGVTESTYTLVVLSEAFVADEWAGFGASLAATVSTEEMAGRVIPAFRHPLARSVVPLHLRFRLQLDLADPATREREIGRLRELLDQPPPAPEEIPCPYPGMRPFGRDQAGAFRGRSQEIDALAGAVRHRPVMLVMGPSGSGKSSLVLAGLLPRLEAQRDEPWVVRTLRPGADPAAALGAALADEGRPAETDPAAAAAALVASSGARRLLVVVDQLEEAFTLATSAECRESFLTGLCRLREVEAVRLVLTLRADFFDELMGSTLWEAVPPDARLEVVPLRGKALREAIVEPALERRVHLEPDLVERLMADAAGEPGALALMQETLVLLWERRDHRLLTLEAYERLGGEGGNGLAEAVRRKADGVLDRLPKEQREIARRVLVRLVQLGEGREDTRRQQRLDDLRHLGPGDEVDTVVDRLADERLLTLGRGPDGDTVDLAHEVLITGWPRLREWIGESRHELRVIGQLEADAARWAAEERKEAGLYRGIRLQAADEWDRAHPDELGSRERPFLDASRALARAEVERERERADQARRHAEDRARSARRLRSLASGLAVLLAVAVVAGVVAVRSTARANANARRSLSRQLAAQARIDVDGELSRGLLLAIEANRVEQTPQARDALLAGLERAGRLRATLPAGDAGTAFDLAFSPDGRALAVATLHGKVVLWDWATGKRLPVEIAGVAETSATAVDFAPDGRTLATGAPDGSVTVWDAGTGEALATVVEEGPDVEVVAYSPDGGTLGSVVVDGALHRVDARTGDDRGWLPGAIVDHAPTASAASADLTALARGTAAGRLFVDREGHEEQQQTGHAGEVAGVAFSPDGRILATGGADGTLQLWQLDPLKPLGDAVTAHEGPVSRLAFTPDGRALASGAGDGAVAVRDVPGLRLRRPRLAGHAGPVASLAFSPNGRTLASGGGDGAVLVWDVTGPGRLGRVVGATGSATTRAAVNGLSATVAPDGTVTVTRPGDEPVVVRPAPGMVITEGVPSPDVQALAVAPHGSQVAWYDGEAVVVWDAGRGARLAELPVIREEGAGGGREPEPEVATSEVSTLAFDGDGLRLVAGDVAGDITVWDMATATIDELPESVLDSSVASLAVAPDGRLAAGTDVGQIAIWSPDGRLLREVREFGSSVTAMAFAPDGSVLATGEDDGTVRLWELKETAGDPAPLAGHRGPVTSLTFHPREQVMASGGADGGVVLWDVDAGRRRGTALAGHDGGVLAVAFGAGGHTLTSTGTDGTTVAWDLDARSAPAQACAVANRNLSRAEWRRFVGGGRDYARTCPDLPPREAPAPEPLRLRGSLL